MIDQAMFCTVPEYVLKSASTNIPYNKHFLKDINVVLMKRSAKNKHFILLILALITCRASAQDTIQNAKEAVPTIEKASYKLDYRHLIAPTALIGFGIVGLESDGLKQLNFDTREEINEHQPMRTSLDNYTQYAPVAMVYGLNALGIKGKHNFRDRTIIYATSQLISAAFVLPLKHLVKEERPDGSNFLSFPSGHTATAFSSAQFMFREYQDTNFWLSISGYSFAVFTGIYRTINDKHWVGDVVAGAGFGMLSTEVAYWLYPKINRVLTKKEKKTATMMMPYYQNKSFGVGIVQNF